MRADLKNANVLVAAVVGSLILLNLIALKTFWRVDVTRDHAYTLSQGTKETLEKLEDPVTITAYFTGQLPAPYSGNARYVRDLLTEYRSASKGKLSFEFIDPSQEETEDDKATKNEIKRDIFGRAYREPTSVEKELASLGVAPVEIRVVEDDQMQTKRAYMGLVIRHQEKKEVIPVVQNVATLEYDLTSLIRKLTRPKMPVIGIVQGHGEPALDEKLRTLQASLSEMYEVRPIDLSSKEKVDDDVDALWIIGPKTAFKTNELKAVDQFLMKGKSAAFFLDSVQVDTRTFQPTETQHGLSDLLSTWGITVSDKLVADARSGHLNVQERRGFMVVSMPVPYPFIALLQKLEGDSPVSQGLTGITFPFATQVSATPGDGRTVTVLARSSEKSWLESRPYNIDPRRDWRSETIVPTGPYDLMVQVSGKLKSHFAAEANTSSASGTPVLAESTGDARIIVAGGSSFLWDDFASPPNQALALNVADWLLLDPSLLAMRTRGFNDALIKPDLSDATRNAAKFGNALGVPVLLAAVGVFRWRMRERRRKTAANV
ncbi:MAG: GldG family protein [Myxococcaceae bacterium]|nr:GldG family protein [Myxococcaceae bacterium]